MIITATEAKKRKPVIDLTGPDGNVFTMIAVYHRTLKNSGLHPREVRDMTKAFYEGKSYTQVVTAFMILMGDRVDFILPDDIAPIVKEGLR